ncbi:MAG: PriCT-2 domain-containing protein [Hyphomicrobiales bacterium]|nr:PriCT-2 domain-containing protein [Hyphomicrobiales bacterium]
MTNTLNNPTHVRLKLRENGYRPVPVLDPNPADKSGGKRPAIPNWIAAAKNASIDEISGWSSIKNASNTGVLTGEIIAIDIDILDTSIADAIQNSIVDELGSPLPTRFGQRPKRLLVARTDKPFKKLASPEYILPDGSKGQIEILCEGQQFVAYGVHPKTGLPYEWEGTPLHETALDDLPCVSEDFCRNILQCANDILIEQGALQKSEFDQREQIGRDIGRIEYQLPTPEIVKEALSYIPNTDLDYQSWFQMGASIHSGLGDQGFEIFDPWSQQSAKYDSRTTAKMWQHLKSEGAITIGTLFWLAHQNGWRKSNFEDDRPVILVKGGALPEIVDQSEEALIAAQIEIYQRAGQLVRPTKVRTDNDGGSSSEYIKFVPVTEDLLSELFMRSARYEKQNRDGDQVPIDIPSRISSTYLARQGGWRVPVITGVIYCPILREDGSIVDKTGYDAATGIYAAFDGDEFLPIPETVSLTDAQNAYSEVMEPFQEFPFSDTEDHTDEAVLFTALMTGFVRASLPTAPMFGFNAPVAGSGKSLLVDLISLITHGRIAAVISPGKTEEELEKRLGAALIAGDAVISLDNCNDTLQGAFLCQTVSQERVKTRILGKSVNVEVSTKTLIVATGNNISFGDDLTRRVLLVTLDPKVDRPENREFKNDAAYVVRKNRAKLVAACLTIFRGFIQAGRPQKAPILGSFPDWSKNIRSLVVWLGLPDPCISMDKVRDNDPVFQRNEALLFELDAAFGAEPFTTLQLLQKAEEREKQGESWTIKNAELHAVLAEFSGGKKDLNKISIGKALKRVVDRMIGEMVLRQVSKNGGKSSWQVTGGRRAKTDELADQIL